MNKNDYLELKSLIGKTVKNIRVDLNEDRSDFGFDLKFNDDDRTILEVYDGRCPSLQDCDMIGKPEKLYLYPEGSVVYRKIIKDELGGGVMWCVSSEVETE